MQCQASGCAVHAGYTSAPLSTSTHLQADHRRPLLHGFHGVLDLVYPSLGAPGDHILIVLQTQAQSTGDQCANN